jgi:hypothetical protein
MQRSSSARPVPAPLGSSLRSPIPLLFIGVLVALVLVALVTLSPRSAAPDPARLEALSDREAITIVANSMRTGEGAVAVQSEGQTRFDDGTWIVSVGDAQFHFTQRHQIVVPENAAAYRLMYLGPTG